MVARCLVLILVTQLGTFGHSHDPHADEYSFPSQVYHQWEHMHARAEVDIQDLSGDIFFAKLNPVGEIQCVPASEPSKCTVQGNARIYGVPGAGFVVTNISVDGIDLGLSVLKGVHGGPGRGYNFTLPLPTLDIGDHVLKAVIVSKQNVFRRSAHFSLAREVVASEAVEEEEDKTCQSLSCEDWSEWGRKNIAIDSEGDELYMTYYPNYGRFNNQRTYLYTALVIAEALNRTLRLPYFTTQPENDKSTTFPQEFDAYFDMKLIKSRFKVEILNLLAPETDIYFAAIGKEGEVDPANATHYPLLWLRPDQIRERWGHLKHKVLSFHFMIDQYDFGSLKASGESARLAREDAPVLGVTRSVLRRKVWLARLFNTEHFECLETDEYMQIRSYVRFRPSFWNAARDFIDENIGDDKFIGVHIRLDTGADSNRVSEQLECPICCMASADYYIDVTKRLMAATGATVVFVGAERVDLVRAFYDKAGIDTVALAPTSHDAAVNANIEQAIHSIATAFIGSLCSTMSTAVWEERVLMGHPTNMSWWW